MAEKFRKLKLSINKGGFNYRQIERFDPPKGAVDEKGRALKSIAKYSVHSDDSEDARIEGIEVFKIRVMKGGEIKGNPIPPGEKFPSNEDVGRWGMSFHGAGFEKRAEECWNKLKKEIDGESSIKS